MTKKAKIGLGVVAAFLLGISLGAGICTRVYSPYTTWLTRSSSNNAMATYAAVQFYQANARSALQAQHEYETYLSNVEHDKANWSAWRVPWMSETVLGYERVLTKGRIALLLESDGNSIQSEKYWAAAEDEAKRLGWKHPDRNHVRTIVDRLRSQYGNAQEQQ